MGTLPNYFLTYNFVYNRDVHYYQTRNNGTMLIPLTRLHSSQQCIRNHIPRVINESPLDLLQKIHTHSLHGFINNAKKQAFDKYNLQCTIVNCYICTH